MGVLQGRVESEQEALFLSTMAESAASTQWAAQQKQKQMEEEEEAERARHRRRATVEDEEADQDHQDEVATLMKALQRTREAGRKQSHLLRRQRHQCSILTGREILLTASNRSDSVAAKEAVMLGNLRRKLNETAASRR
mgnify:CR=1 FL=1